MLMKCSIFSGSEAKHTIEAILGLKNQREKLCSSKALLYFPAGAATPPPFKANNSE